MSEACSMYRRVRLQVRHMEKRPRNKSQLGRARHFLHCVILEQRAATEELKASNSELERLLDEILATRSDLKSLAAEDVEETAPPAPKSTAVPDRSVTELKREADAGLEQASKAINASTRLRKRSQLIREALRIAGGAKPPLDRQRLSKREHQVLTLI